MESSSCNSISICSVAQITLQAHNLHVKPFDHLVRGYSLLFMSTDAPFGSYTASCMIVQRLDILRITLWLWQQLIYSCF